MVLDAERRIRFVADALYRVVVEIDVGDFQRIGKVAERVVVVLAGDLDATGQKVLDRVVAAVVPEFEPRALRTGRQPQQLMPETDPHERHLAEQHADVVDGVGHGGGVGGSVGKEDPVGLERQYLVRGRPRRNDRDAHVVRRELAEDVVLAAEVAGDDAELALVVPFEGLVGRDELDVILTVQPAPLPGASDRLGGGHRGIFDVQIGLLTAAVAQMQGQRPRVHPRQHRDAAARQKLRELLIRAEVRRRVELSDHEAVQKRAARLHVVGIAPVVADLGTGQRHELPRVRGVGKDLLIAGHAGVEDRFAHGVAGVPRRPTPEHRAVRQREKGVLFAPGSPVEIHFSKLFHDGLP